jgi:hypothetical protein
MSVKTSCLHFNGYKLITTSIKIGRVVVCNFPFNNLRTTKMHSNKGRIFGGHAEVLNHAPTPNFKSKKYKTFLIRWEALGIGEGFSLSTLFITAALGQQRWLRMENDHLCFSLLTT